MCAPTKAVCYACVLLELIFVEFKTPFAEHNGFVARKRGRMPKLHTRLCLILFYSLPRRLEAREAA